MSTRPHADATLQFAVPGDWIDRTVVVYSAPPGSAAVPPNVVVAYDRPAAGEDLNAYATRQVAELTRTAQGFRLDVRRDLTFAGRAAVEVTFRWAAGPGTMQQRQIFSILADGRVASVACTAAADQFAAADEAFVGILQSVRWSR